MKKNLDKTIFEPENKSFPALNWEDLKDKVPDKWKGWRLKSKAKKFYKDKKRYIKRYRSNLTELSAEELRDQFQALKEILKNKTATDDEKRDLFRETYGKLYKYLPDTVDRKVREFFEFLIFAFVVVFIFRAFVIDNYQVPTGSMIPTIMPGDKLFASKFIYGFSIPFTNFKFVEWNKPARGDIVVFEPPSGDILKKAMEQGFFDPPGTTDNFVKRVIGLPGDTILLKDQQLYINGKAIPRRLIKKDFVFNNGHQTAYLYEEKLGSHTYKTINHFPKRDDFSNFGVGGNGKVSMVKEDQTLRIANQFQVLREIRMEKIIKPYKVPEGFIFVMGDNRDGSQDSRFWGPVPLTNVKGAPMIIWFSWVDGSLHWRRIFSIFYDR